MKVEFTLTAGELMILSDVLFGSLRIAGDDLYRYSKESRRGMLDKIHAIANKMTGAITVEDETFKTGPYR